ncbi:cob(I)yrinic acid a,c-diamide adenosyltransferase [Selenomonas sputigena]|uniref:Corrinoid adenosyltransferase n=1 Tax=Selenomonas sputigena TaxID=69823 RepID=A0ABV3X9Q8_9FIRM
MGVYTKTGDKGQTSLYTGERVDKDALRVDTYGALDEAGSALAMARAFATKETVREKIVLLQKKLSLLMADIASLGQEPMVTFDDAAMLEKDIDEIEAHLPKLTHFLVPGDTQAGAMLDFARTTVRRAERRFYALSREAVLHKEDQVFLNRLSDYCFMLMRLEEAKD